LPPLLQPKGLRVATLALDDLYLPRAERERLAAEVHPLLATRGVPGTHDAPLGRSVLESLRSGGHTRMPRFDKGRDDRLPESQWDEAEGPFDVVVFEGWCVGARPQPAEALAAPVNALERDEDPEGVWRAYANAQLAGPYQDLFRPIGFQALLLAPEFATILGWRRQQEHELIERTGRGQSDAELARFVQHYERLTGWIAEEMPARADLTARLGPEHELKSVTPDGPQDRSGARPAGS
jgi:D-glycerate 3-kinase